ncbi:MAG: hypothetical protein H6716_17400 [Polyangiaceae bacterium]|nr:hypothetical protein [Polyangiaceae bacterium]
MASKSVLLAGSVGCVVFRITSSDGHLLATVDGHRSLSGVVQVAMTIAC